MNRRLLMSIFLVTTACACHGSLARSALIVTVGDLTLPEGGRGFVDVMISSSDGSDELDAFSIGLSISPAGGARQLKFVDPVSDTHLTDPKYLLFSDSAVLLDDDLDGLFGSLISRTEYSGGDGTMSFLGVPVPTTEKLLVRLEVTAATFRPPMAGDTFEIGVDFALFLDPFLEDIDFNFPVSPGTVTITSQSAVIPEPASMAIWAILLAVLVIGMGRRQASE